MNTINTTRKVRIRRSAAEWHNLLHSGEPTERELIAFADWLRQSPDHEAALSELETSWELMRDLENDLPIQNLLGQLDDQSELSGPAGHVWLRRVWWRRSALAAAAALVLAVGAVLFVGPQPDKTQPQLYWTALGQQAVKQLADGTEVTLNTASEIHASFSDTERIVYLQRGEVLFKVAPDPARSFTVVTESGAVRALGTLFNMRIRQRDVVVSLLEGKVEVSVDDAWVGESDHKRQLAPGEQITYSGDGDFSGIKHVNGDQVVLWRKGKINFVDTPLREVVAEINRYTPKKLEIGDPEIADKRINAFISINNIDSLLAATEAFFGVESEFRGGKYILSQSRDEPGKL